MLKIKPGVKLPFRQSAVLGGSLTDLIFFLGNSTSGVKKVECPDFTVDSLLITANLNGEERSSPMWVFLTGEQIVLILFSRLLRSFLPPISLLTSVCHKLYTSEKWEMADFRDAW